MRPLIKIITNKVLLAVVAVAIVAGWYFSGNETGGSITYQTQPLTVGGVESIVNTSGSISPLITVEVGTEVSGLIDELFVDYNAQVSKGQVIARINDQDQRTRVEQVEADLISSQASLEQSKANLLKSETQLELDRKAYERQKGLYERQLISSQDLEKAEAAYRISQANLEVSKASVTSSEARLTQTRAQLQQAKLDLEKTQIRAPVDGVVIDRAVDVGQTVSASLSAPTLFTIAQNLSEIQIEAAVQESDIGKVKEQMDVRFRVDAFPGQQFSGRVDQVRIASTVTQNVVIYTVIIRAENPGQMLLPGMTANVDIILGRQQNVLRAPNTALRFQPVEGAPTAEAPAGTPVATISDRTRSVLDSLELAADKRAEIEKVLLDQIRKNQEINASVNPANFWEDPRERLEEVRKSTENSLRTLLTPDQFEAYMAATQAPAGGMPAGAAAAFAQAGGMGAGDAFNERPTAGAAAGERPAGGFAGAGRAPAGGSGAVTFSRGQVWILRDGLPAPVSVQVGLADNNYSQIVSDVVKEGDEVIVRAIRSL